jgi:hypothetical protein
MSDKLAVYRHDDILGPTNLIESYQTRRVARAPMRKAAIDRERAKLRQTYITLRLPVPVSLLPPDDPEPAPFIPYRLRPHRATGQPHGRRPLQARADAVAAGAKFYRGRICKYGHSPGWRFVGSGNCRECHRLRQEARKHLRGTWHSTEPADAMRKHLKGPTADHRRPVVSSAARGAAQGPPPHERRS